MGQVPEPQPQGEAEGKNGDGMDRWSEDTFQETSGAADGPTRHSMLLAQI